MGDNTKRKYIASCTGRLQAPAVANRRLATPTSASNDMTPSFNHTVRVSPTNVTKGLHCCVTPSSVTCQYHQLPLYSKFSVFYNYGHRLLFLHRPGRGFRTNQTRLLGFLVTLKSRVKGTKFVPTPHVSLEMGQQKARPRNALLHQI